MIAKVVNAGLAHAGLLAAVVVTFVPLVWMLGLSLKPAQAVFADPLNPLPLAPTLANYQTVFARTDMLRQLANSVIFAGGVTLGQLLVSVPAAYAFSRPGLRGASWLFPAFLLTLPIPFVVVYVPNYLLLANLGLLNTFPGLIVPQLASAYGVFLLRQHFRAFPPSVLEAARLDGAGEWDLIWRIILPATWPAVAALAVFVFISTWNEFVWPLLVAPHPSMQIATVGVAMYANAEGGTQWGAIMAAAALACTPTLLAYLAIRRGIVAVLLEGAVKG